MSTERPAFALGNILSDVLWENPDLEHLTITVQEPRTIMEDIQKLANELVDAKEEANHEYSLKWAACGEKFKVEAKLKTAEERAQAAEEKINKHLYAILLIDGEAAIFGNEFFRSPKDGAKEAAKILRRKIRQSLNNDYMDGGYMTVHVKVYANIEDLAERLYRARVISSKDKLRSFAKAFTDSFGFEFVDVESEKTTKMRSMLSFHYHQAQCKKIFFAGCHDNTYIENLHFFRNHRPESLDKVVLVETTPAPPSLHDLGFTFTSFENVFRSVPLPSRDEQGASEKDPISVLCDEMPGRISPYLNQGPFDQGQPSTSTPELYAPPMQRSGPDTRTGYEPTVFIDRRGPRKISFNRNHERLDPVRQRPRAESIAAYKRRFENLKELGGNGFCNAHYINRNCERGNKCFMEHEAKLSAEELNVLRHMARKTNCKNGPWCADYDCFASHHCPWGKHCDRGEGKCEFKHLKGKEKKPRYVMEEGKKEIKYLH